MIRAALTFTSLLAVAACAPTVKQTEIIGPAGTRMQSVKCSQSPDMCMSNAAATCGGPYQVIDSESHAGGLVADVLPGPVTWYGMTFQCGASDGKLPAFAFRGQEYTPPPVVYAPPPVATYRAPVHTSCRDTGFGGMSCTSY